MRRNITQYPSSSIYNGLGTPQSWHEPDEYSSYEGGQFRAEAPPKTMMKPRTEKSVAAKKSSMQRRCDRIFDLMLREICQGDIAKMEKCFEAFMDSKLGDRKYQPEAKYDHHRRIAKQHVEDDEVQTYSQSARGVSAERGDRGNDPYSSYQPSFDKFATTAESTALKKKKKKKNNTGNRNIQRVRRSLQPTETTSPPPSHKSSRGREATIRRSMRSTTKRRSKSMVLSKSHSMSSLSHARAEGRETASPFHSTSTISFSDTRDRRKSVNNARQANVAARRLQELQRAMRAFRNNPCSQTRRRLQRAKAAVEGKHVEAQPTSLNPMGAMVGIEKAPSKFR
mmetsp:Transcript_1452/g.2298  ORF Transcript_1452/g.2298 Transcript_1452/m.2298 type:complete len:339 (+) Transcript_1452:70-1086(+)